MGNNEEISTSRMHKLLSNAGGKVFTTVDTFEMLLLMPTRCGIIPGYTMVLLQSTRFSAMTRYGTKPDQK